jgi:hypothetical protein
MTKTRTPSRNKKNLRRKRVIPRLEAALLAATRTVPHKNPESVARIQKELEVLKQRVI